MQQDIVSCLGALGPELAYICACFAYQIPQQHVCPSLGPDKLACNKAGAWLHCAHCSDNGSKVAICRLLAEFSTAEGYLCVMTWSNLVCAAHANVHKTTPVGTKQSFAKADADTTFVSSTQAGESKLTYTPT